MHIELANLADWDAIEHIYREGIRTELATLTPESDVPDGAAWFDGKLPNMVFKAVDEGEKIAGWASLSAVSKREVYAGVAEVSVYIAKEAWGHGIGFLLLDHVVKESEKAGIWTLNAGIFPENIASVNLHKKAGFRIVGTREKIGKLNGVWRDVLLMERRSKIVF